MLGVAGVPERWEYDVIAANIANGGGHVYDRLGFVYRAYAPPVWSFILAALQALPIDRVGIQILQALLCAAAAVVFGELAARVFRSATIGAAVGLLVALQPSLLYYSVVKSDPLPLNVLLVACLARVGVAVFDNPSFANAIRFGLVAGIAGLARGTPLVAVPLLGLFLFSRKDRTARPAFGIAALVCVLTLIPWLTRNALVLGRPMIASTASENFWRGNHQGAGGGVRDRNGADITTLSPENAAFPRTIRSAIAGGNEIELSAAFTREARAFVAQRPHEAIVLLFRKLRLFWIWTPSEARDYDSRLSLGYNIFYLFELTLGLLGLRSALQRPSPAGTEENRERDARVAALWCASLAVAISLIQSAFYVQGRHRFLVEPILLMFAALPLADVALKARARLAAYEASRAPRSGRTLVLDPGPGPQNARSARKRRGLPSGARDTRAAAGRRKDR